MQLLSCWPQKPRAMDPLPGNSVLRSGTCSGPSSTKSRAQAPLPTAFHVLVWGHGRFCSLPDPLLVTRVSRPCSHTHRPQHDPAAAGQAAEQEPGTASGSHQGVQPARGPARQPLPRVWPAPCPARTSTRLNLAASWSLSGPSSPTCLLSSAPRWWRGAGLLRLGAPSAEGPSPAPCHEAPWGFLAARPGPWEGAAPPRP